MMDLRVPRTIGATIAFGPGQRVGVCPDRECLSTEEEICIKFVRFGWRIPVVNVLFLNGMIIARRYI